jgi:myo-inositol-1(or 4)-monophosphatase
MSEDLLSVAVEACRAGASVLERHFRSGRLEIETKAANDFVTQADRGSERAIVEVLRARFPRHRILGEEGGDHSVGDAGETQWVIDPLDGTTNFIQGLPIFAVSIGCRKDGVLLAGVVHDPLADNWFLAERGAGAFWNDRRMRISARESLDGAFLATGYPFRARAALDTYLAVFRAVFLRARAVRRCGSAALDLAYVASGVYDGFFEFRLSPWDLAAGCLMIEEAGGELFDLDGGASYFHRGNLLAGSPGVARDLREVVGDLASERVLDTLAPLDAGVLAALGV